MRERSELQSNGKYSATLSRHVTWEEEEQDGVGGELLISTWKPRSHHTLSLPCGVCSGFDGHPLLFEAAVTLGQVAALCRIE